MRLRSGQDRRALGFGDLIEPNPDIEGDPEATEDEDDDEEATEAPPPKIEQLIRLLKLQLKGDKSLVFSQFTSYLRKVCASPWIAVRPSQLTFCRSPTIFVQQGQRPQLQLMMEF